MRGLGSAVAGMALATIRLERIKQGWEAFKSGCRQPTFSVGQAGEKRSTDPFPAEDGPQPPQGVNLDLSYPFASQANLLADLLQCVAVMPLQTETPGEYLALPFR